jgi:hypothetical protein
MSSTGLDDECSSAAADDMRAHEQGVGATGQRRVRRQICRQLFHRIGFAGQGRLVDEQQGRLGAWAILKPVRPDLSQALIRDGTREPIG